MVIKQLVLKPLVPFIEIRNTEKKYGLLGKKTLSPQEHSIVIFLSC